MKIEIPYAQLEDIKRRANEIILMSRQREECQARAQDIIEIATTIQNSKPAQESNPEREQKLIRIRAIAESLGTDQAAIDIADICTAEL